MAWYIFRQIFNKQSSIKAKSLKKSGFLPYPTVDFFA